MATDLTNTRRTAYATFYQTARNYSASWMALTSPVASPEYTIEQQEMYGATLWESFTAAPTPQDIKSQKYSTNIQDWTSLYRFTLPEVQRNPGLLVTHAGLMGQLAGYTLTNAFWTLWRALASTTHPFSGTAPYNSAAINCVDSFTIVPPNAALAPLGAPFAEKNEYALAFSSDAIDTMLAERTEYHDISGNAIEPGIDGEKPMIIVPAANKYEAMSIRERTGEIYDGAGLELGHYRESTRGVVVPPGKSASAVWGLWYRRMRPTLTGQMTLTGPIAPWLAYGPTISIGENADENYVYVRGTMGFTMLISPDVTFDVQLSTP